MRANKWLTRGMGLYACFSLVSMATMSISAAFFLVTLVIAHRGPGGLLLAWRQELRRSIPFRRLFWTAVVLVGIFVVSLIAARIWPLVYDNRQVHIRWFRDLLKAWYLFLPFFLYLGWRKLPTKSHQLVLRIWILTFAVLSAVAVQQFFWGWPRPSGIPFHHPLRYHATAFLGHHLSLANCFIFPFFACLDQLRVKKSHRILPRWALLACTVLGFFALYMTFSRTLWVALPAGITLWLLWILPVRQRVAAIVVLAVVAVGALQIDFISKRLSERSLGVSTRIALWKANWEFFKRRPVTGVGWRKTEELSGYYLIEKTKQKHVFAGHAHNNFLEMLGGTGLPGTAAWLYWCVWVLLMAIVVSRKKTAPFGVGLLAAWVVFHINGLTQVNFWEGKVLHQAMWSVGLLLAWWDNK